jgi:hypothetical protein
VEEHDIDALDLQLSQAFARDRRAPSAVVAYVFVATTTLSRPTSRSALAT